MGDYVLMISSLDPLLIFYSIYADPVSLSVQNYSIYTYCEIIFPHY